jgi:hypothetical protein
MKYTKEQLNAMTNPQLLTAMTKLNVAVDGLQARLDARKNNPLEAFKDKIPSEFKPSNVGELTKTYWGFFYSVRNIIVGAGAIQNSILTISEDGAFAIRSIQKVVYERTGVAGAYEYRYLDPEIHDDANLAYGLTLEMSDSQSSRSFMSGPIPMEHIGDHRKPLMLKKTYAYLPNSNLSFDFANTSNRTYVVSLVLNGYRVRLPNQKDLASLSY